MVARLLFALATAVSFATPVLAQFPKEKPLPPHTCVEDKIYGRRDGHALTMDVFTPKEKPNGAGVIICVSAQFESNKSMLDRLFRKYTVGWFLDAGYVVFAVIHSSQPKYTVPEIVEDMHRAVRYIKANAKEFKVDPDKLGITGGSSGGNLALMMGCASKVGDPNASDPVEKQSSTVAAVSCFFPVTDFLEFDKDNLKSDWERFRVLFDILEFDSKTNKLERITPARRTDYGRRCSPLYCYDKDTSIPPTLIIHGDADALVPIDQSRKLIAELKKCGVKCELEEVPGMKHDPIAALQHLPKFVAWFDKHLLGKSPPAAVPAKEPPAAPLPPPVSNTPSELSVCSPVVNSSPLPPRARLFSLGRRQ